MSRVAAFVPVKGSSQRISCKNLRLLDGKPLFLHTLEKLLAINDIDVYLDTESEEIIRIADYLSGLKILRRSPSLANNSTDGNRLFLNEVTQCAHPIIVQHLCTSPFIKPETILKAISLIGKPSSVGGFCDSSFLAKEEKQYTWVNGKPSYDIGRIPNSGDLQPTVIETMGLYVSTRDSALKTGRRIGDNPAMVMATPLEAVDVNWPADLDLAQQIAAGMREKSRQLYQNLSLILSSPLLSDLLDDLGFANQVIRGLNFSSDPRARVLGPAKTLKLRKMRSGDDYKGIYEALGHYDTLVPGDMICIENEASDYAYFGELNANLAIRQGVKGVVIGGMTRDVLSVKHTGLPVFSKGYICQDVRGRAVLDSFNQRISINGIEILPGDMIFADVEGIVVIPRSAIQLVFNQIKEKFKNERSIVCDIASGASCEHLLVNRGEF